VNERSSQIRRQDLLQYYKNILEAYAALSHDKGIRSGLDDLIGKRENSTRK